MLKPLPALRVRDAGTVIFTVFLVLVLGLAVQGAFQTRASIADTFNREADMQRAQIDLQEMRRLQIDEENSLRGFVLTRDPFYVQQYAIASAQWAAKETAVHDALVGEHLDRALQVLDFYDTVQSRWRAEIAVPLLERPRSGIIALDKKNKAFIDNEAQTAEAVRTALVGTSSALARSTQDQINRSSYVRAFWLLVFGLLAVLFNAYQSRLTRELEQERMITGVLQQAFRSGHVPLPSCEVGSTYLSATSRLRVGGDVFDVFRLSETQALLLVADVSGKGVDAAVLTAFVRFSVRSIALRGSDPAAILTEVNQTFAKTVDNPSLFVTMIVGILDCSTGSFTYASAGHDSAYVRRSSHVEALPVTGPLLGVMEAAYATKSVLLKAGETIVLATDGLTEARSRSGELLGEQGAMEWIASGPHDAQALADYLTACVRRRSGNRPSDDLALLVIRREGGDDA
ncbi:MAG TPA: SpoIIE family protein phosphatase [Candidatus Tyrphobacter sp.]